MTPLFTFGRKKYGGLGVCEMRRLKQLEEENRKLKQIVADLSLDKQMLQDVLKKTLRPAQKRSAANDLIEVYRASVVRVCKLIMLHRSLWYHKSSRRDDTVIRMRMREIALTSVRYGCRRIGILLRKEGWRDNNKRIHRLGRNIQFSVIGK